MAESNEEANANVIQDQNNRIIAESNEEANANEIQDQNNRITVQERFKELRKFIGEQEVRIQTLQNSAFQLANYYFVFQGVILAAISNTTTLVCSDAWFVFSLSLLAAVVNFFALLSIGIKYVQVMNLHDDTWSEYNALERRLEDINNNVEDQNHNPLEIWRDKFSQRKRYVVLGLCLVIFGGFAVVMLSGPWCIICKHDKVSRPYQEDLECFKLCKASKCMKFCYAV